MQLIQLSRLFCVFFVNDDSFFTFITGLDFPCPDKSFYFFENNFFQTNGHNKILAGIIINLNQTDVPAAPSSIFFTLKNENQMANKNPVAK